MRVFEIPGIKNGKKPIEFVAGLSWQPVRVEQYKKDIAELSKSMNMDLAVYSKNEYTGFVGLGATKDGAKAGQLSIALVVAQALERERAPANSLAVFTIPGDTDTYYYVMRRDGQILADGDKYGPEDQIRSELLEHLSMATWDLVICPDYWPIDKAVSRTFESFLTEKDKKISIPKNWYLRPATIPIRKTVVQAVGLLSFSFLVWYGWSTYQTHAQAQQAMQQAQEAERQRIAMEQANKAVEPWISVHGAMQFASACERAINNVGVIATNWALSEMTCEQRTLTVKFERSIPGALVSDLKALHPQAQIDASGVFASVVKDLELPEVKPNSEEKAPALASRMEYLNDLKYKYSIPFEVKAEPAATPSTPWLPIKVSVSTVLRPTTVVPLLNGPAFRVLKISGSMNGPFINYQLSGTQYATP